MMMGLHAHANGRSQTRTSVHTTLKGTAVCCVVEKPFQAPSALLFHLFRVFPLKHPVSYATNIQNDLQIHKL